MSATPASMLQIVATGLQDRERLNAPQGKPSVAFYQKVFNKRTRWASQWVRVEFDGLADFGRTTTTTLPIRGELITRATLVVVLPDILTPQLDASGRRIGVGPAWSWTNGLGHAICSNVQFLIDDQIIDEFDSQLLEVIDEQERPVEHFDSTNTLLARDPSAFSDQAMLTGKQKNPQTLEVVFPFWWNRGPGPTALPIQALWKDKVQLRTTFRAVQQCVYTAARINPLNPPLSANQGAGPLPNIAGCGFFTDTSSGILIYDAASSATLAAKNLQNPFKGRVVAGKAMPPEFHFQDAYWIVEYVSLEDREAAAFRLADMEFPIQQHVAFPPFTTNTAGSVRMNLEAGGLVRDLTWVAQRVEAPNYNAHFLFSRDLAASQAVQSPSDIPWWPNAQIPNWDYGDGYIRPAFADRYSDPIVAAKLLYRGRTRFEHEGVSLFRSLIPALNCKRTPLIDRYIYRYDFGFWATGGLAEALEFPEGEIRGCANWDKLPNRELVLTMNQPGVFVWSPDVTRQPKTYGNKVVSPVDFAFPNTTMGFRIRLVGAGVGGAVLTAVLDYSQVQSIPGFRRMYVRTNPGGSAALVAETGSGFVWIAVAGAAGQGQGGAGSSAADIGGQGVTNLLTHDDTNQTDECLNTPVGGGGGGGRYETAGPGMPDGLAMTTDRAFAMSHRQTGGRKYRFNGGDGYYGGGSGAQGGGGGGSFVSCYLTQVGTVASTIDQDSSITLTPAVRTSSTNPNFNILAWITRYNRLRIVDGRGALMFNDTV